MVKYICDGCGKEEEGIVLPHTVLKPRKWFVRADRDKDTAYYACSYACIETIDEKHGDRRAISPI